MKIAIHGPMCSGKTTLANLIMQIDNRHKIFSFGQPIKDLAIELFNMKGKDRTLLISIADKMRDIDKDVWAKYTLKKTKHNDFSETQDVPRFNVGWPYFPTWDVLHSGVR